MNRFLRHLAGSLARNWARNILAVRFPELEQFAPPQFVTLPPGQRPLVLAPHADDEAIGCGGTLRKYADQGIPTSVVVLTDGSLGDRHVRELPDGVERTRIMRELAATRRQEAAAAARTLGVQELRFIDVPDSRTDFRDQDLLLRLRAVMEELRPDIVFVPFIADRHVDHWNTNRCLFALVEGGALPWLRELPLCGYEVWSPLYANILVNIDGQLNAKREAIQHYRSQLAQLDYLEGALGLNRFRAICGIQAGHAEAFYLAPFSVYYRLYEMMRL